MTMEAYKKLEAHFADVTALSQLSSLANWDRSVMMPEQGGAQRARQMAVLGVKIHALQADPRVGAWIAAADRGALDPWQAANLDMIARLHGKAVSVPERLVRARTEQESVTEIVWRAARAEKDFARVRPELEKLVSIVREYAAARAAAAGVTPYESLLDHYAPGMRVAEVNAIFDDLAAFLPGFIDDVIAGQENPLPLKGPFPPAAQEALCRQAAALLGFDFSRGRLDVSAHPFSMGIGDDVRLTTRYREDDFMDALQATAHEVGHGLYDRFTPREWHHQPVGASQNMGMAIHESQSLSLDMQLGRSLPYWEALAPLARKAFGSDDESLSARNLCRLSTRVTRGFIRIEADEVTYPAHIIFRYRLERDLIGGKLEVKDIPEAWNAAMQAMLGVTPPDDAQGCLQDIHWHAGYFGYFPAYALGAVAAAQLVGKMRKDIPDLDARLRGEGFGAFTGWLRDNVQAQACLYTPAALIERATGEKLSVRAFRAHLRERYLEKSCSATSAQGARRHA